MIRRVVSIAILGAASGCATSAANGPPPAKHDRIIAITESNVIRATELSTPQSIHVKARPDSVFALLRAIYPAVGVEIKLFDPPHGEIGNRNFSNYYRLKGIALRNYVGCGTTATGPGADTYRVTMSLVSYVFGDGKDGSNVTTRLEARADDTGLSKGMISCTTTGMLEGRVNEQLLAKTGG